MFWGGGRCFVFVFGAAAAAGKLLGLDADGIANALGLALSRAGGTQQALLEKSLAKRAQSGFAAEAGVFAAQLAAAGLSADYGHYVNEARLPILEQNNALSLFRLQRRLRGAALGHFAAFARAKGE